VIFVRLLLTTGEISRVKQHQLGIKGSL